MTRRITLVFQDSLQGAAQQARGLHAGRFREAGRGRSRPACARSHARGAGAGGPPGVGGLPHLPAVGRDRGRGRRGPEGVVHGAAAASQVRPSVGGRGGGGWIREAGHCGRQERAELSEALLPLREPPTPTQDPSPRRPRLDTCPPSFPESGFQRRVGGRRPRSDSRKDGLVQPLVPVPKVKDRPSQSILNNQRKAHCTNLNF